jgi:hypothetical protein
VLVWKSRFIPKIIGFLLILNGFAYVIASVTFFLLPQYKGIAQYMLIPEALGEPVIVLWLLIKGVRDVPESMPQPSLETV